VLLRPLDAEQDAKPLYDATHSPDGDPSIWTYLYDGPYVSAADLERHVAWAAQSVDPLFFAVVPQAAGRALGVASYLEVTPDSGVVEIGNIWFGATLQRTTAASEAIYLLGRHAFDDLGYRRLAWRCNALNAASRRAAERFGFTFEGIFRNHRVVKGRNRDTAWYSILAEEWPAIRRGFEAWLAPANFDEQGRQKVALAELIGGEQA
jgi:RimJ/RimL family protein N-acetyltransferase